MTGISTIDQQHRQLVAMLNGLNDAVQDNAAREDIYRLIDEVIAFTRLHFDTEEQLMLESGFPGLEWHRNKHKELIQDALHLKGKLAYVGEEMFTDWFTHWPFARTLAHIQYADQQFEEHLLQSGMKK